MAPSTRLCRIQAPSGFQSNPELPQTVVGIVTKSLVLRYRLSGVTTGAPVLNTLWAEYRPVEPIVRKRHWRLEISPGDGTEPRGGAVGTGKGRGRARGSRAQWGGRGLGGRRGRGGDLGREVG